jgi:L-phenylalanine/L-methionine N-acetyltransferase
MDITIRRAEPDDADAITAIHSGPKAMRNTLQLPYPTKELWRKRLADPLDGNYHLVACVDGEVVGNLGLGTNPKSPRRRHVGSIGMSVRDDWQGKGLGTALMQAAVDLADNWLNLTRLELDVFTDNEPAIGLYKKFGFVIEGTCIRYAFRDGEFVDTYLMARIRKQGG